MTQAARVKLTSTSLLKLGNVCGEIMTIGEKTGVKIKGPIPLPVKATERSYKEISLR